MAYRFPLTVRGYHIDVYQHVNNASYLQFTETAQWELFDNSGFLHWMTERGIAFVVVNINISYRTAAYMNDRLVVESTFHPVTQGKKSGKLTHAIYRDETLIAQAEVTYCCINLKAEKALPMEGELLTQIEHLVSSE
ncbi:Long-chain acyl-CoA thioesterase FadM [Halomonadaceae bacterium LMG 33818]|uniref:acyl-CoA thioesterase n=1 Tax=Cernens ardua TaxID=3402176 RepID=UPI003EDBA643